MHQFLKAILGGFIASTVLIVAPHSGYSSTETNDLSTDNPCAIENYEHHPIKRATCTSPFYGLAMLYKKVFHKSKEIQDSLNQLDPSNPKDSKKFQEIIEKERDIHKYLKTQNWADEHEGPWYQKSHVTTFFTKNSEMHSCYQLRIGMANVLKSVLKIDALSSKSNATSWFNPSETKTMNNLDVYSPEWKKHTDLSFVCKLLTSQSKSITPALDYRDYEGVEVDTYFTENKIKEAKIRMQNNIESSRRMVQNLQQVLGSEVLETQYPKNSTATGKICLPEPPAET